MSLKDAFKDMSIKELAFVLHVPAYYLYKIRSGVKKVSAKRAIAWEELTCKKLTRQALRPDIFTEK